MRTAKKIALERLDKTGITSASACSWVLLKDIEIGFAIEWKWTVVMTGTKI